MRRPAFSFCMRAAVIAAGMLCVAGANAQPADQFFKGKTISITVGYSPGGAYDLLGRLVSRHMGKHIPGNPSFAVQNMPGAASLVAANWLYNVAPKDGTAMGVVSQTVVQEELLKNKGARYKTSEFNWIGRVNADNVIHVVWHTSKAITMAGAKSQDIPTASTGPGSPSEVFPRLLNAVAGTRFKSIRGYAGASAGLLAMERGEVDGALTTLSTMRTTFRSQLNEKKAVIIIQFLSRRSPDLPDVPAVTELVDNEADRRLLMTASASGDIGRSIIAPPGIPPDRLKLLRDAFDACMKDPELLAEVRKAGYEVEPATAAELERLTKETLATPPDIVERMQKILAAE